MAPGRGDLGLVLGKYSAVLNKITYINKLWLFVHPLGNFIKEEPQYKKQLSKIFQQCYLN